LKLTPNNNRKTPNNHYYQSYSNNIDNNSNNNNNNSIENINIYNNESNSYQVGNDSNIIIIQSVSDDESEIAALLKDAFPFYVSSL